MKHRGTCWTWFIYSGVRSSTSVFPHIRHIFTQKSKQLKSERTSDRQWTNVRDFMNIRYLGTYLSWDRGGESKCKTPDTTRQRPSSPYICFPGPIHTTDHLYGVKEQTPTETFTIATYILISRTTTYLSGFQVWHDLKLRPWILEYILILYSTSHTEPSNNEPPRARLRDNKHHTSDNFPIKQAARQDII